MEDFWNKGRNQLLKALREEEREEVAPLRDRLQSEDDPDVRKSLKNQIKAVKDRFRQKRKAASSSLFSRL